MSFSNENEDSLFFGSIPVTLCAVEGEVFGVHADTFDVSFEKNNLQRAKTLDPYYSQLLLPCIPALDIKCNSLKCSANSSQIPTQLRKPFLKTSIKPSLQVSRHSSHQSSEILSGYQSGIRSAIVPINGKFYRLKGCGNGTEGFTLRSVTYKNDPNFTEIRGCMFENTCFRELYMSSYINEILQRHNFCAANIPIGWWVYSLKDEPKPKVKKMCAVFETKGDRRLNDHVLVGLEKLIPLFFSTLDTQKIQELFPKERKIDSKIVSETWIPLLTQEQTIIDLCQYSLQEIVPETIPQSFQSTIPSHRLHLWTECCDLLRTVLPLKKQRNESTEPGSLYAYIFWRLGYESGLIQRILFTNGISWGTYEDSLGLHCNAHPNNLILLPQNKANPLAPLLAPLDFDMAFLTNTFNEEFSDKKDMWMTIEKSALVLSLAGDVNLNSGACGYTQLDDRFLPLKWALRDTLVSGFLTSFNNQTDIHPSLPQLTSAVYSLLKMALIVTEYNIP